MEARCSPASSSPSSSLTRSRLFFPFISVRVLIAIFIAIQHPCCPISQFVNAGNNDFSKSVVFSIVPCNVRDRKFSWKQRERYISLFFSNGSRRAVVTDPFFASRYPDRARDTLSDLLDRRRTAT
ncbi:hypothetical protein K0M31_001624 [Melipona bicolor]|uniref:Uncharacterized protein n=1 Tax=Melipona bicolor TaxID=60889 RepID=A0AA40GFY8_9HYME|nr:hypothetical protein K0M31_001624 [Melipona bicolor]